MAATRSQRYALRGRGLVQVIRVNPAHYSAWEWRWRCLAALRLPPASEAAFLRRCTTENPKNYQLWNYRRRVAIAVGPSCAERVSY